MRAAARLARCALTRSIATGRDDCSGTAGDGVSVSTGVATTGAGLAIGLAVRPPDLPFRPQPSRGCPLGTLRRLDRRCLSLGRRLGGVRREDAWFGRGMGDGARLSRLVWRLVGSVAFDLLTKRFTVRLRPDRGRPLACTRRAALALHDERLDGSLHSSGCAFALRPRPMVLASSERRAA